jgi:hypothetical protein
MLRKFLVGIHFFAEAFMAEDFPSMTFGTRRNEDIALDMMKFIAMTSGYGKIGSPGAGFQGGTVAKAEDYATHLLDLYARCLAAVDKKK